MLRSWVMGAVIVLAASTSHQLHAQRRPTQAWTPGFGAGVARALLQGGGSAGAVRVTVSVTHAHNHTVAAQFSADSYVMQSGVATPGCVAGGACEEVSTLPGVLIGASGGIVVRPVGDALAFVGAVGGYYGPSIRGNIRKGALAMTLGLDYELPGSARLSPILGVRFVYLTQPLTMVRSLIGPGAGLEF